MYESIGFTHVVDKILHYHKDQCRLMHKSASHETYSRTFAKAEAAREMLIALKTLLPEEEQESFNKTLKHKLDALYQAMFFNQKLFNGED